MERQTVGKNLIVIRERRMWTQVRLAKEAGVSPTTVSGIETGRISRPRFGTLCKQTGPQDAARLETSIPQTRSGEGVVAASQQRALVMFA